MPLAFARFTSNPQTNPTGLLGTDGQLYVLTSGESAALDTLTPELTTSLEAVGGGSGLMQSGCGIPAPLPPWGGGLAGYLRAPDLQGARVT